MSRWSSSLPNFNSKTTATLLGQFGTYHKPGGDGEDAALPLSDEEISILNGVLSLNEKKVTHIMTPMEVGVMTDRLEP